MQKTKKNYQILGAIFASFLLHLLIFTAFFISKSQKEVQPQITLEIELISTNDAKTSQQKSEKIHLKKSTHRPSDHIHLNEEPKNYNRTENFDPTFHPLPAIPDDLRDEAFSSRAVARFYIGENGNVAKVELVQPCANPRLNVLLLKSLQKWQFPTQSANKTQEISVTFLVK